MVKTLQATAYGVATVVKCQKFAAAAAEAAAAATLSHRSACTRKVVQVEKKVVNFGALKEFEIHTCLHRGYIYKRLIFLIL